LPVETNIVIFELVESIKADQFVNILHQNNIICSGFGGQSVRLVLHLDVTIEMVHEVCKVLSNLKNDLI
jgi:threonine aldolase